MQCLSLVWILLTKAILCMKHKEWSESRFSQIQAVLAAREMLGPKRRVHASFNKTNTILIHFSPSYFRECWKLPLLMAKEVNFVFNYFKIWEQVIRAIIKILEVPSWAGALKLRLFPRVGVSIYKKIFGPVPLWWSLCLPELCVSTVWTWARGSDLICLCLSIL